MNKFRQSIRITTASLHEPAANTAAVVTLAAAGANKRRVVRTAGWSYSAAPTAGKVTISDAGTDVWAQDITGAGPAIETLEYVGGVNTQIVVTLAAGGGTVVGKLNVLSYTLDDPEG